MRGRPSSKGWEGGWPSQGETKDRTRHRGSEEFLAEVVLPKFLVEVALPKYLDREISSLGSLLD